MTSRISRITSIFLGAALIVVSPGLPAYQAFAQVRTAPTGASWTPTGANAGATGVQAVGLSNLSNAPTLTPRANLTGGAVLPAVVLPAAMGSRTGAIANSPISRASPAVIAAGNDAVSRVALTPSAIAAAAAPRAAAVASSGKTANPVPAAPAKRGSALGRTLDLSGHLDAFNRLGGRAAAEEEPVEGSDSAAKPVQGLNASDASKTAAEAMSQPGTPAPAPEGPTKLPRSLWGLFWGHHIITIFGINFHMLSQPYLVTQTLSKSKALMGLVRNVHMGSMSFVNVLPLGWLIDKVNFKVLFVGTSVFRALLMGAIPMLFLSGHLSFAVLLSIVAANPLVQSAMIVADSAARKAFLGTDRKLNKEAAAILGKYDSIAGMVFPILAGLAVGGLVHTFGLGGYAVAYGVYAVMLLASIPVYMAMVTDPRDPKTLVVNTMGDALRLAPKIAKAAIVWTFWKGPKAAFHWVVGGGWKLPFKAVKAVFYDLPRAIVNAIRSRGTASGPATPGQTAGWKEALAQKLDKSEATKGFAYILRNNTLSTLMMVGAIEAFLGDAMPMVVLPNFIIDSIGENSGGSVPALGWALGGAAAIFAGRIAWAAVKRFRGKGAGDRAQVIEWAVLGATLALLAWKLPIMLAAAGGIFAVMLAAEYFGRLIASSKLEGAEGDKIIEKYGHGKFYKLAALSSSLFWLMWLVPAVIAPHHFWINLGVVLFVQFGIALAHAPVGIVMAPVVREQIPDDMLGRVDSAFNMIDLIFMAGGALIAGLVIDQVSINTAMFIIACLISATSVLEWMVPKWIFPDGNHPAPVKPPTPPQDPPKA
ncbi:MAG: hypothetical protein HY925_11275 [Elusimicrobia bacterium]|nr:hypothetical protein [Elusimicrobiota bacterium]